MHRKSWPARVGPLLHLLLRLSSRRSPLLSDALNPAGPSSSTPISIAVGARPTLAAGTARTWILRARVVFFRPGIALTRVHVPNGAVRSGIGNLVAALPPRGEDDGVLPDALSHLTAAQHILVQALRYRTGTHDEVDGAAPPREQCDAGARPWWAWWRVSTLICLGFNRGGGDLCGRVAARVR